MSRTIALKRGTEDALKSKNPKLQAGEPIVVFCNDGNIRLKVGNGKNYFNNLPYSTQIPDNVSIDVLNDKITLKGFNTAKDMTVPVKVAVDALEWFPFNPTGLISGIQETDRILNISNNKLGANVELIYNSDINKIQLLGANKQLLSEVDTADFIVSGVLEDVSYDSSSNCLVFTWNTADGSKTNTIQLQEMFSPYTAGNGLDVVDNTISIKIASDSETFLTADVGGLKITGILEALDMAAVSMSQSLGAVQSDIASIKSVQETQATEIEELHLDLNEIQTSVSDTITTAMADMQETLDSVSAELNSLKSIDFTNFVTSEALTELSEDIVGLHSDIESIEENIVANLDETLDEMQDSIDTLSFGLATTNKKLDDTLAGAQINISRIDGGRITDVTNS